MTIPVPIIARINPIPIKKNDVVLVANENYLIGMCFLKKGLGDKDNKSLNYFIAA